MNENFHNSRTSHDIDMKLGPLTKAEKSNMATSKKKKKKKKKKDNDVRAADFDVIVFFTIFGQSVTIRKWDSGRMVYKFSLIVTFYFAKLKIGTKKSLTQLSYYCFK